MSELSLEEMAETEFVETPRRHRREAGFTMVELLVVLAILALIATFAATNVFNILGGAKSDAAEIQIGRLSSVLDLYLVDTGGYPTTEEGLAALVRKPPNAGKWNGPYLKNETALTDPWGNPYLYREPGDNGPYDIISLGSDGQEGGEGDAKDITN